MATPGAINPVSASARPGISAKTTASFRVVTIDGNSTIAPGKGVLDGTLARDIGNTGFTTTLRPGLLLAKNASSGKYANWSLGTTAGALAGNGTTFTLTAAQAVELVRWLGGTTGSVVLTGPATANGVARQMTATVTGVNTGTGVVTINALGVNQVERVRLNIAATGGNIQLNVQRPDGTFVTTGNAAWSATDATFLANINTALDTATGVVGGIVASAISAVDTDLGFTLTNTGTAYAGNTFAPAQVVVLPTSSTAFVTERVTTAVNGAFVAGSVVSRVGWASPISYIRESVGVLLPENGGVVADATTDITISAIVDYPQLLPAPTDAGLKLWIMQSMSTLTGGKFAFNEVI